MENNINFRGAFLIKHPTQAIKDKIQPMYDSISKKQLIENISGKGDTLYVIRNRDDKEFADIIQGIKNIEFKYYPKLDTKSGLNSDRPIESKSILRSAAKTAIKTKQMLENYFKPKPKKPVDIVKVQADNLKTIEKKTLINTTGNDYRTNIDHQNGVCSVYTMIEKYINGEKRKVRHTLIQITPPDKYGISYARIAPLVSESSHNYMQRLAIKNGEVIFEYNEPGSKTFIKNESSAKKYYIDMITKYNEDMATYNTLKS